jgi:hypothetical protein
VEPSLRLQRQIFEKNEKNPERLPEDMCSTFISRLGVNAKGSSK